MSVVLLHRLIALGLLTTCVTACSSQNSTLSSPQGSLDTVSAEAPSPFSAPIAVVPAASFGAVQSHPAPQSENTNVTVQTQYYSISGVTANEMRSQLNQYGPTDSAEGNHYDASTRWMVNWSYHYTQQGDRCVIDSVTSTVDVMFTLPQWQIPASASASLVAEWQRYMAALQIHENGHKDNGVAAGRMVSTALYSLPPQSSCQSLQAMAQTAVDQAIAYYNQQDLDYDRMTQHGSTQGAIFPSQTYQAAHLPWN